MADITDSAQTLADDNGLDLDALLASGEIVGTGSGGNVLKSDVQGHLDALADAGPDPDAESDTSDGAAHEPAAGARFRVAGDAPLTPVVSGAHRVLHPGPAYALDPADAVVKALVKQGALVRA